MKLDKAYRVGDLPEEPKEKPRYRERKFRLIGDVSVSSRSTRESDLSPNIDQVEITDEQREEMMKIIEERRRKGRSRT